MTATPTKFSQVNDKLWTLLDGDANLTAFMTGGKKFKFTTRNDAPTILRPSDCPALIVRESMGNFSLPDSRSQLYPVTFDFELAHHQLHRAYIIEFFARVITAMMASLYLNLGLTYVRGWKISDVKFRVGTFGEKEGDKWAAWVCEFPLTINVYCDARSSTAGLFAVDP